MTCLSGYTKVDRKSSAASVRYPEKALAVRAGNEAVVELLLGRGADPTKGGAPWSTPLAWARRYERGEIAASIEEAIRCRQG